MTYLRRTHKPKLKQLKPQVPTLQQARVPTLNTNLEATARLRGRAAVERREAWLTKHPLCEHCEAKGITTLGAVVDHKTPLWKGGADNYETNGQTLCNPCHDAKTALEAAERAGKAA